MNHFSWKRAIRNNNPYTRFYGYLRVLSKIDRERNLTEYIEKCNSKRREYRKDTYSLSFLPKEILWEILKLRVLKNRRDLNSIRKELQSKGVGSVETYKRIKELKRLSNSSYTKRNKTLLKLGFSSYQDYLQSSLWREIRSTQLKEYPTCFCCRRIANQVHHRDYAERTLVGKSKNRLVTICDSCHRQSEFDNQGNKIFDLREVNKRMSSLRRSFQNQT